MEHGSEVRHETGLRLEAVAEETAPSASATRETKMSMEWAAKYRGLMEAAPDAMVVVNAGGEIVLLNLQAEKQFGYRRDELIGQEVTNTIPEGFAERLIFDGTRSAAEALAPADWHRDRALGSAEGR